MNDQKFTKKISVIIISYNSENFIRDCIKSLIKYLPNNCEIIVFDNASQDNTVKHLEEFVPKIKLLKSTENIGFAKGNNTAAKQASGKYLFFLNPDTQMQSDILEKMTHFYEDKKAGLVAPRLVMPDGQTQPSVKKLPTIRGAFQEYIMGQKNAYAEFVPKSNEPVEVEFVYAAAILISADFFWDIGGFDERYFLYYEDAQLCKDIRAKGKKIYYLPDIMLKHIVGGTKSKQDKILLNKKSAYIYHGLLNGIFLEVILMIKRLTNKLK